MVTGKILTDTFRDLQEITGCRVALFSSSGEVLTSFSDVTREEREIAAELLGRRSAGTKVIQRGGKAFALVNLRGTADRYLLMAEGDCAEMTARVGASELKAMFSAAGERMDRGRFFREVLLGELKDPEIRDRAARMKIRVDRKRRVFLVETSSEDRKAAQSALTALFTTPGTGAVVTQVSRDCIAVVEECSGEEEEEEMADAEVILEVLRAEAMVFARVSTGTVAPDLYTLRGSFEEAATAMEVGRIFYPDRKIISSGSLGIGRLIDHLPEELCRKFLDETFDHDIFAELDEEALHTIQCFFDNDLNISETARELYLHRNTLVYRLEKLQKTCGLDIRKFDEAMTFRIAMMVYNYLQYREN